MEYYILNEVDLKEIQDFLTKRGDSLNNITMHKCSVCLGESYVFNSLAMQNWYADCFKKEWHKDLSLGANLILLWSDDGNLESGLFYLKQFGSLAKFDLTQEILDDYLKEAINANKHSA